MRFAGIGRSYAEGGQKLRWAAAKFERFGIRPDVHPHESKSGCLESEVLPTTTPTGSVTVGASTCLMARRSPCHTPRKIKPPIRKSAINSQA